MTTFVALLRAVNVSGQNRVPMAELRTTMAAAGYGDVRTYLQSGNIVFAAAADPDADAGAGRQAAAAQELATAVHRLIERKFGCDVRVLVLTAAELARVAVANPFLRAAGSGFDEKSLHATFLEEPASEADFAGLAIPAQPGERAKLAAGGRALLRGVVAPLAAAAGIVWAVRKNGRKLVNRPVLLPEASTQAFVLKW